MSPKTAIVNTYLGITFVTLVGIGATMTVLRAVNNTDFVKYANATAIEQAAELQQTRIR